MLCFNTLFLTKALKMLLIALTHIILSMWFIMLFQVVWCFSLYAATMSNMSIHYCSDSRKVSDLFITAGNRTVCIHLTDILSALFHFPSSNCHHSQPAICLTSLLSASSSFFISSSSSFLWPLVVFSSVFSSRVFGPAFLWRISSHSCRGIRPVTWKQLN